MALTLGDLRKFSASLPDSTLLVLGDNNSDGPDAVEVKRIWKGKVNFHQDCFLEDDDIEKNKDKIDKHVLKGFKPAICLEG